MKRRALLAGGAAAGTLLLIPRSLRAAGGVPWSRLRRAIGDRLVPVQLPPIDALFTDLRNPYAIGANPALTQTVGWADAWTTAPSAYAVAARDAGDIAEAVGFARAHGLRLAVRGGAHSYLGTSNAADSLLLWTRRMNAIEVGATTVRIGAGAIWAQAYDAVTTQHGRYVQGGGCTTVGVAGLVQSGGFGSFSKRYGTAASSLRSAQIVTADGVVRTVDATHDPELFWALKGGGGGSFGVVTEVTLALHELPEYFGAAVLRIRAASDDAYRDLVRRFVDFYAGSLFNPHWGESVTFTGGNTIAVNMVAQGLDSAQVAAVWKPFLTTVRSSPAAYAFEADPILAAGPARGWWNPKFWSRYAPQAIALDPRPGHGSDWWWAGDGEQAGWYLYGYDSVWMPQTLLASDGGRAQLADALFRATRAFDFALHFNKGLAGAPQAAIDAAHDTATNPVVTQSFALAICADGVQGPFPGVPGHAPDLAHARRMAKGIGDAMAALRSVAPAGGSYLSESNYFNADFARDYWGSNAPRLIAAKRRYDPENVFRVRNGIA